MQLASELGAHALGLAREPNEARGLCDHDGVGRGLDPALEGVLVLDPQEVVVVVVAVAVMMSTSDGKEITGCKEEKEEEG